MCRVSCDLCNILQEYQLLLCFFYNINDRALDITFVEIPISQQKMNQHSRNKAQFDMDMFLHPHRKFLTKMLPYLNVTVNQTHFLY